MMISPSSPALSSISSPAAQPTFHVREVCRVAIASINVFGYRGRFSRTMSTAGLVRAYLTGSVLTPAVAAQVERVRAATTEVSEAEIDEALALAASLEGDGFEAYVRRAASSGDYVSERYVGLLASAPQIARARRNQDNDPTT